MSTNILQKKALLQNKHQCYNRRKIKLKSQIRMLCRTNSFSEMFI